MPRGNCENCGRHDMFVYATPLAFGTNAFVCARCLPHEWDDDEDDEIANGFNEKAPLGSLRRGLLTWTAETPYLRPFTQVSTSPFTLSLAKP
jgi:hypothetical protein